MTRPVLGLVPALVALMLAAALPAAAEEAFGVGRAKLGMRLGEFRYAAHPAGQKLVCSHDPDRPKGVGEGPLDLPKAMERARVARCALYTEDHGTLRPATVPLAGGLADFWLMAIEDGAGVERVFQLYLQRPADAFDHVVADFIAGLGAPAELGATQARWHSERVDAMVVREKGSTQVFVVDNRLQELMQARVARRKH